MADPAALTSFRCYAEECMFRPDPGKFILTRGRFELTRTPLAV
jgi:hypothetical protein